MAVGLIVSPELSKSLVERRGILTVPDEDATVSCPCVRRQPCNGLSVNDLPLPARSLELYVREMGDKFIDRMAVRGFEWVGGNLKLHGPWPSYEFSRNMADVESALWREAEQQEDRSIVLPFIIEQPVQGGYSDYLLVGDFMARDVLTEIEVPNA